ncbi:calponin homology domain-containing protein DDB_G0272472-like [Ptychodera flava]|uniref:calponin homology domain-containing protein DDB_G0272472-like n=1 Tax=Ptychodera flava TaxID=63121 RepID=UPI003969CBBE
MEGMKRMISTNPHNPPPVDSMTARENTSSSPFTVNVSLDEASYQQQTRDLDRQVQTRSVREKKEQLKAAWEKIKAEMDKTEHEAIVNETSIQAVDQHCRNSFGKVRVTSKKRHSLAISLHLPTLYNLYRLKQTCLSGSFPDSFEPLLITDKMREEADKVGLQLKLKATYDQARFDELELFFINRDGGGLKPVKVYDVIEGKDAEEIHIDDEDTGQKSDTTVTEGGADRTATEHRQSLEDIQTKLEMERKTLDSQLKEAKEEKATLEERCKELTQKLESTEQSLVSQRMDTSVKQKTLQSELEEKKKLITQLEDKVEQSELKKIRRERYSVFGCDGGGLEPVKVFDDVIEGKDAEEIHIYDEDTSDQKSDSMITEGVDSISQGETPTLMPQQPPQHHREMSAGHMMQASAATGPPTSPVVYSKLSRCHTKLISHIPRPQMYRSPPQGHLPSPLQEYLTSPHLQGQIPIPQEIQTSTTQVYDPTIMPQRPPQHHHEMSAGHMMQASAGTGPPTSPVVYSKTQRMPYPTVQPHTQETIMGQMRPQHVQYQPDIQSTPRFVAVAVLDRTNNQLIALSSGH